MSNDSQAKPETVLSLLAQCEKYDLSGTDFVKSLPLDQVVSTYNGIGPDSFPRPLCEALDRLAPEILPSVLIHDARFTFGDGSREWFDAANDEFESNGLRIATLRFRWYNPRRYITRHRVRVYAQACRLFGWSAYCQATAITRNHPQLPQS